MKKAIAFLSFAVSMYICKAQYSETNNGIKQIHSSEVMYKKNIIRALDLREKQNLPLFSRNKEITALLMDGVTKGKIKPYENDSLRNQITIEAFCKKLLSPEAANIPTDTNYLFLEFGENWREIVDAMKAESYSARDLYQLEISEEVIFNKQESRMVYNIKTITVYIPSDHPMNITGIQTTLASFDYNELVENIFKDNPRAIWYNSQNDREHKYLSDAFDLRLFSSYIVKVSNSNDAYLADLYSSQEKGIMASSWATQELLEYEHNLWEY